MTAKQQPRKGGQAVPRDHVIMASAQARGLVHPEDKYYAPEAQRSGQERVNCMWAVDTGIRQRGHILMTCRHDQGGAVARLDFCDCPRLGADPRGLDACPSFRRRL